MSTVPIYISAAFVCLLFFKEMEGYTAVYLGKTIRQLKYYRLALALGKAIRMCIMSVLHPDAVYYFINKYDMVECCFSTEGIRQFYSCEKKTA